MMFNRASGPSLMNPAVLPIQPQGGPEQKRLHGSLIAIIGFS